MFIDETGLSGIKKKLKKAVGKTVGGKVTRKLLTVHKKTHAPVRKVVKTVAKKTFAVHKKTHAPLKKVIKKTRAPVVKQYRKTVMPVLKKAAPIISKLAPLLVFIPAVGWIAYAVYATYAAQAYQVARALKAKRAAKKAAGASDAEIAKLDAEIAASEKALRELNNVKTSDNPALIRSDAAKVVPLSMPSAYIPSAAPYQEDFTERAPTKPDNKNSPWATLLAVGGALAFLL